MESEMFPKTIFSSQRGWGFMLAADLQGVDTWFLGRNAKLRVGIGHYEDILWFLEK